MGRINTSTRRERAKPARSRRAPARDIKLQKSRTNSGKQYQRGNGKDTRKFMIKGIGNRRKNTYVPASFKKAVKAAPQRAASAKATFAKPRRSHRVPARHNKLQTPRKNSRQPYRRGIGKGTRKFMIKGIGNRRKNTYVPASFKKAVKAAPQRAASAKATFAKPRRSHRVPARHNKLQTPRKNSRQPYRRGIGKGTRKLIGGTVPRHSNAPGKLPVAPEASSPSEASSSSDSPLSPGNKHAQNYGPEAPSSSEAQPREFVEPRVRTGPTKLRDHKAEKRHHGQVTITKTRIPEDIAAAQDARQAGRNGSEPAPPPPSHADRLFHRDGRP